uniref:Ion-translocating oxidoreductase complex subunit C n=1 Tax=Candidatus Kentrum sp. SD TaxID=2126332 RepID=A0A450Y5Q4_9GAMM|nr:MAG: electron transport complex protein RnfC [Candidatus Kentron sp. SD]VFK40674.1 MAG: electron transport complex protein RnfC [Candidatus Kentron sp. SD]VFK79623.1 MAG: electron transport complex protein RnfC [Candidatus Kentron sp. SD]
MFFNNNFVSRIIPNNLNRQSADVGFMQGGDTFGFAKRVSSFSHGVHPETFKSATYDREIRRMSFSPEMILPLSQHFGAPSKPLVHEGQEVVRGQPIAAADGFMSVPLHAPATGTIKKIALMPTARGPKTESIVLELQAGADQMVLYEVPRDVSNMTSDEIIKAVQSTGMVGLGGASFPTHVKMSVPKDHKVDTVMVNGCECEPYLTTDHRVMLEKPQNLLTGIRLAMKAVGAERAVIGVEDNKQDAIGLLRLACANDKSISVGVMETKYPQGAEKMMIKALLGREVPSGGFPSAVGVSVYNVATLAQLGVLLPRGQGLIERVVTVTGPGIEQPGNYLVALGTPLRFVLEHLGYHGSANHIILGGPMMGVSVASLDVPITKSVSGVLVLNEEEEAAQIPKKVWPCIKCAECLKACPIHLNPSQLGLLAASRQYETMESDFHLNDCFECGCCSYVCPSGIPLVQYFRIAKMLNREAKAA